MADIAKLVIQASADTANAIRALDDLDARIRALSGRDVSIRVNADTSAAVAEMDRAAQDRTARIQADLVTGDAQARLDELSRDRTAHIRVNVDGSAVSQMQQAAAATDNWDKAVSNLGQKLTGLLIPAIVGIAPAIVPLTAATLAAGGAMVSAFGSATLALGPFAASMMGTYKSSVALYQAVDPLNQKLQAQQAQLDRLTPGSKAYNTQLSAMQKTQDQINAAMSNGTAVQQKLVVQMSALRDAWQSFQTVAEKTTGPIITQAFKVLTDMLPKLIPLVRAVGPIFQHLLTQMDAFVNSNKFTQWVQWLVTNGVPNLQRILNVVVNIFKSLGQVIVQFAGPGALFTKWLDDITQKLVNWGAGGGFTRFIDYVRANLPAIESLLKSLGTTLLNVGKALTGMGGTSLTFGNLVNLLAKLSPGQLQLIAAGFIAIKVGMAGLAIVETIATGFAKLAVAVRAAAVAMGLMKAAQSGVAAGLPGVAGAAARGGVASAGGAAAGDAALGGMTAAAAASLIAIPVVIGGALAVIQTQMKDKANAAASVIQSSGITYAAKTTSSGLAISKSYQDLANQVGLTIRTTTTQTTQAAQGNASAVKAGAAGQVQAYESAHQATVKVYQTAGVDAQKVRDVMGLLAHSMNQGQLDFAQSAGVFANKFGVDIAKLGAAVNKSGQALATTMTTDLQSAMDKVTNASRTDFARFGQFTGEAGHAAFNTIQTQSKADYQSLQQTVKKLEDDTKNGRVQNIQADQSQVLAAMKKFEDDATNGRIANGQRDIAKLEQDLAKYYSDKSAGNDTAAQADLTKFFSDMKGAYHTQTLDASGFVVQAINGLAGAAKTAVDGAVAQAQSYIAMGASLSIPATQGNAVAHAGGFASGGLLGGEGTETSDSNIARVSKGEYIVNAASTKKHLGLLKAINNAKGFADGGMFDEPAVPGAFTLGGGAALAEKEIQAIGQIDARAAQIHAQQQAMARAAAASAGGGPGGTAQPSGNLQQELTAAGIPQSQWGSYAQLVAQESSGNPLAYNPQGTSSGNAAGLLQITSGTFAAYGSGSVYNPVDNLRAGAAYINARYGGNVGAAVAASANGGYASGTMNAAAGWALVGERGPEWMNFGGGEQVLPHGQTPPSGGGGIHIHPGAVQITINGNASSATVAQMQSQMVPSLVMALKSGVGSTA